MIESITVKIFLIVLKLENMKEKGLSKEISVGQNYLQNSITNATLSLKNKFIGTQSFHL